ncbi:MAG: choice-of-anchor Q domain-containing protein, partial [Rudaea sp.]
NSTINDNKTTDASSTFGTPGFGGGIYTNSAAVFISRSTISGNSAVAGGGIYNDGSMLTVVNSTISGNVSTGGGGGINSVSGTTDLYNATITDNKANSDASGGGIGGGVANGSGSTLTFRNSIIAMNASVLLTGSGPLLIDDDCTGTLTSQANSIMYSPGNLCVPSGPIVYVDPDIGPLQFNGGSTQTHALLPVSPAIDTGETGGCTISGATLTTDQRGFARPVGAGCDVGSFEVSDTVFRDGFDGAVN